MENARRFGILLAMDDDALAAPIRRGLEEAGFEFQRVTDTAELHTSLHRHPPALLILHMDLPGANGTELLKRLRAGERERTLPIIALSDSNAETDRIVALELGADDFLGRPFSVRELSLRVKAIVARLPAAASRPERLRVGRFSLSPETHEVLVDGVPLTLSALDYRLLAALIEEGGRVVSRERLIALAWGAESTVSPRTVDTQLRRLRVRLGAVADQIRTVRGFGYRITE